jgi:hypothetical protein
MYAFAAYGVQCLFVGCRDQVQGGRVCVQEGGCAAFLFLDSHPATLHLIPTASNQALHTIGGKHTYSLEHLMTGIEVPETC